MSRGLGDVYKRQVHVVAAADATNTKHKGGKGGGGRVIVTPRQAKAQHDNTQRRERTGERSRAKLSQFKPRQGKARQGKARHPRTHSISTQSPLSARKPKEGTRKGKEGVQLETRARETPTGAGGGYEWFGTRVARSMNTEEERTKQTRYHGIYLEWRISTY